MKNKDEFASMDVRHVWATAKGQEHLQTMQDMCDKPDFIEYMESLGVRGPETKIITLYVAILRKHVLKEQKVFFLSKSLCSALENTSLDRLDWDNAKLPFSQFLVVYPKGSLRKETATMSISRYEGPDGDISFKGDEKGLLLTYCPHVVSAGISLMIPDSEMVGELVTPSYRSIDFGEIQKETHDNRVTHNKYIINLLFDFLVYINSPQPDVSQRVRVKRKNKDVSVDFENVENKKGGSIYKVGRFIHIDKNIRAYCSKGDGESRSKLSHRFIVRGHHRNQPYGSGRSSRRMQWIRPHWKGPDYAEIVHKNYQVT